MNKLLADLRDVRAQQSLGFPSTDPLYKEILVYIDGGVMGYAEDPRIGFGWVDITDKYWPLRADDRARVNKILAVVNETKGKSMATPINKWIIQGKTNDGSDGKNPHTVYYLAERSRLGGLYITKIFDNSIGGTSYGVGSWQNDIELSTFDAPTRLMEEIGAAKTDCLQVAMWGADKMYADCNNGLPQYATPICGLQWFSFAAAEFLHGEYGMSADCQYFIAMWLDGCTGGFVVTEPRDRRLTPGMFVPLQITPDISTIRTDFRAETYRRTTYFFKQFSNRLEYLRDGHLAEVARIRKAAAMDHLADCIEDRLGESAFAAGIRKHIAAICADMTTDDIIAYAKTLADNPSENSSVSSEQLLNRMQKLTGIEDNFPIVINYILKCMENIQTSVKDANTHIREVEAINSRDVRSVNIRSSLDLARNQIDLINFDANSTWTFLEAMLRSLAAD